jgi:pimeloyl-ACP methyl ester carboxylesterase
LVLLMVLPNTVLYAWRAVVRRREVCGADEERLGVARAAWAFAQECAALAAVILLIPAGWFQPRCRSGAGTRGAAVLVHGWGLNRGSLWLLRRRLLRDGWSPVCCLAYRSVRFDIEGAAQRLRRLVDELAQSAPHRAPVALVGHSLGGLVLRYYARRYPAPQVRRLVTLGTPHHGTETARGLGPWGRRLVPGSSLLATLNAADRVPQQFDVIVISSSFDATILPPGNAQYAGAFNIELSGIGHNALLFSAKVYGLLAENLAAPPS